MNNKITFSRTYKGVSINTYKLYKLGAYTAILEAIHNQMQALLSHHSRITVMVFTLHLPHSKFPDPVKWNQAVGEFFKMARNELGKKAWLYNKHVVYSWAREVGEAGKEHYHCFIAFEALYLRVGSISSNGYTGLWHLLNSCWKTHSRGYMRADGMHTVNRGDKRQYSDAFYHLSYMAKVRDKDFGTGEQHKRFSSSRLKPKKPAPKVPLTIPAQIDPHFTVVLSELFPGCQRTLPESSFGIR